MVARPAPIPRLAVIVINWNTRELLRECLASVYAQDLSGSIEVWVVDNASQDGSAAMVRETFPQTALIENETNLGFARGNNQAIERTRAEFILLLNSDTRVHPGAFDALLRFLQSNPRAGAAGPRVANPDGSLQTSAYPLPTLAREAWRMFHLDRLFPYGTYAMDRWDPARPRQVDVLLGACLLLRRAALDQVGLLNESYFMYSEEPDLAIRLNRAGWELYWVPAAEIVHFGGRSTNQAAQEMFLRLYRSKVRFFEIHHGRAAAAVYRGILVLAALARLALSPAAWLLRPAERGRLGGQVRDYGRLIRELVAG